MSLTRKYQSQEQPELFFWAEDIPFKLGLGPRCWHVVAQVTGFPATEACDDWFANRVDAERIAYQLAQGEDVS